MNDTPVTPAELFKSLRASTAAMLGLDVDHLSTEQTIRVDRAVTLRLLCDHLQAQQLHGVAIDVHEFISASEALERMVGGNPASPPPEARFGPSARERLRRMIEQTVLREDPPEVAAARAWKDEQMAIAAAMPPGEQYTPSAPAQSAPPPQITPPPPQPEALSDIEKMERANSRPVPAYYLASPWRAISERDRWSVPFGW